MNALNYINSTGTIILLFGRSTIKKRTPPKRTITHHWSKIEWNCWVTLRKVLQSNVDTSHTQTNTELKLATCTHKKNPVQKLKTKQYHTRLFFCILHSQRTTAAGSHRRYMQATAFLSLCSVSSVTLHIQGSSQVLCKGCSVPPSNLLLRRALTWVCAHACTPACRWSYFSGHCSWTHFWFCPLSCGWQKFTLRANDIHCWV